MRIVRLDLLAVGPFTDVTLNLDGSAPTIHIIYGENEAGKSSTLRALRAMFFGFERQRADAFLHDTKDLRVGARLRLTDGREQSFIRRKGNTGTLLDAEGKKLADQELVPFVGNVTAAQFDSFFGIDHESLVAGGQSLLAASGEVGEALLAAGAGGRRMQKILETLAARADELYKKGGSNPRINKTLAELDESRKRVQEVSLRAETWLEHTAKLEDALRQLAANAQRRRDVQQRQSRLRILSQAIPTLQRRRHRLGQIEQLGPVPEFGPDFPRRSREAASALREAEASVRQTGDSIANLEQSRARIAVRLDVLDRAELIENLHGQLAACQDAQAAIPRLRARLDAARRDAADLLQELRPGLPLDDVEQLRLSRPQRARIDQLAKEHKTLEGEIRQLTRDIAQTRQQIADIDSSLAELGSTCDPGALEQLLAGISSEGINEKQLARLHSNVETLAAKAAGHAGRLKPWDGAWEALAALAAPSQETISLHEKALEDRHNAIARIEEVIASLHEQIAQSDRQIGNLLLQGKVADEASLQAARRKRDQGWALIRQAWLDNTRDAARLKAFCGDEPLDRAYEQSVRGADGVADELRLDATRVAQHAKMTADRQSLAKTLDQRQADLVVAQAALAEAIAAWRAVWSPLKIEPLTPREMRAWRAAQQETVALAEQIAAGRKEAQTLEKQLESAVAELSAALAAIDQSPEKPLPLARLLEHCQGIVKTAAERRSKRQVLDSDRKKAARKLEKLQADLTGNEAALNDWREMWTDAVAAIQLDAQSHPDEVQQLIAAIGDLFDRVAQANAAKDSLAAAEALAASFGETARELAQPLLPNHPPQTPPQQLAADLWQLLLTARNAQAQLLGTKKQLDQQQQTLAAARNAQVLAVDVLKELCRIAGCRDASQLPAIEAAYQRRQELAQQIQADEDGLIALGSGKSIDELEAQAKEADPAQLAGELEEIAGELEQLQNEDAALNEQKGAAQQALAQMAGQETAAAELQKSQGLAARIADWSAQYVRLRVAAELLKHAVERYRRQNQDPLLARAAEIFVQLADHKYARLEVEADGDKPVLMAIRSGTGKRVAVEGMSSGTRDQLYLALRIASLEQHIHSAEPFPFIVDDVLVNFDDRRAAATLRVLGDLSDKTQAILFTHHAALVSLARRTLPGRTSVYVLDQSGSRTLAQSEIIEMP